MKKKISILTIALILTMVLFGASTYLQKKLIHYEPMMKCFVAASDIDENEKMVREKMKEVEVPIPLVMNMRIIQNPDDITNLYANNKIYSGQLLVKNQFDTKEKLSIFEGEQGKEKISIRIKTAENGVSYRIREKSLINVYATMRTEYSNNIFGDLPRQYIGNENDGYCNIKVLDAVKVIGVFDNQGMLIEEINEDRTPDTVMISVTHNEAMDINLIRDVAIFNITEVEGEVASEGLPIG